MRAAFIMPGSQPQITGQATYGMSNLRSEQTGLPFIVFVSQQNDAKHAAKLKWSPGPKVQSDKMGSYSVNPFEHKAGPKLNGSNEKLLQEWIEKNQQVILDYWSGEIEYTDQMLSRIQSI